MSMIIKKYLILGTALIAFYGGYQVTKWYWSGKYNSLILKLEKANSENLANILEIERLNRERADAVEQKLLAEKKARDAKEKIITKEVIKYVKDNSNSNCSLDPEWVRISSSATPMPRASEASASTDGGESKVYNLGEALEVVTTNYGICQVYVDKLNGWIDWYKSVSPGKPE